jgi:hypothetical protein
MKPLISIIKSNLRKIRFLRYLRTQLFLLTVFLKKDPKVFANIYFRECFNRDIDWDNPVNLFEKINLLQIYSDTSLWTRCADKYLVREYVKERGCGDILNELYGKWDSVNEIDWESLPDSFVLKTNHACGQVIFIKNKQDINKREINSTLNEWLSVKYGYRLAELHYMRIKPCITAEKLLVNKSAPQKPVTADKIWCFHGIPESVLVVFDRTHNKSASVYDLEWNNISDKVLVVNNPHFSGKDTPKPKSFEKMIESAKKLSAGIPQVRVDFYDVDGKAVFGEMTFSSGYDCRYTDDYYDYLGGKIDLSTVAKLNRPNKFVF